MDCDSARERLLDDLRGRLSTKEHAELEAHVATCDDCRSAREVERITDDLIGRLPRLDAPITLKRELRARYLPKRAAAPAMPTVRVSRSRWSGFAAGAVTAALVAAVATIVARPRGPDPRAVAEARLEGELVNDHLRLLYAEHPLDIVSTGIHDVKPWFAGKLDFAPPVTFAGDADFPLQGGAVAYVLDRKAACFVFKRRLHTISLLVTRADGLVLSAPETAIGGRVRGHVTASRGFHMVDWQDGEFAYALVSDVNADDLLDLARRVVAN
jgi:anti-sigma factor RsiW